MKIVQLTAENIKRLRAVEITPDGNVVIVAGANAQGKTSVLDAIWLALGGREGAKGTTKPIREGETKARVKLDLGDLIVERIWVGPNTTLTVKAKDGAKYSSPQKVLDNLVGKLSFDPLAFANAPARAQFETLLEVIELPFDPDELAAQRRDLFEQRTISNRELKNARAVVEQLPSYPPETPTEPVDVSEVVGQRDALQQRLTNFEDARQGHLETRARIEELQEELRRLESADAEYIRRGQLMRSELPEDPQGVLASYTDLLASATDTNAAVEGMRRRRLYVEAVEEIAGVAQGLTSQIEALDQRKADGIRAAKMPVPGLSFDDDGVTLNGVPFSQSSGAEQLKVSVAIAIAANPQIRVLRISDGSLLDRANMALLAELADRYDFQVWVERVDESGTIGVVIEDGAVKA